MVKGREKIVTKRCGQRERFGPKREDKNRRSELPLPRRLRKSPGLSRLYLGALLLLCLCGCASVESVDYRKVGNPKKEEYVIGVSDALRIAVWKMPEVNTEAHVRPDGNITVPLIGEVKAAGRTPMQLRTEIRERLTTFVKDEATASTVTVALVEVNSYVVTVSGKVNKPGVFHLKEYATVSEAIALAGGPTLYAAADDTVIIRSWQSNPPKRIPIHYVKITRGLAPEEDLVLYRGDNVFVP